MYSFMKNIGYRHNTLVFKIIESMGSQWVAYIATQTFGYECEGDPCVHSMSGKIYQTQKLCDFMDEDERISVVFSEEGTLGISLKKNYAKSGGFTNEKNGTIEIGKISKGTQAENHVELCSGLILVSVEDDTVPSVNSRSKSDIKSFNRELDAFESRIRAVLGTVRPLKMEFRPAVEEDWSHVWFEGRLSRTDYFLKSLKVSLFMSIFFYQGQALFNDDGGEITLIMLPLFPVVLIYFWAINVRRIHDLGYSGWLFILLCLMVAFAPVYYWDVIFIVSGLILLLMKGTDGPNKYGPDPLNTTDISVNAEEE